MIRCFKSPFYLSCNNCSAHFERSMSTCSSLLALSFLLCVVLQVASKWDSLQQTKY